MAMLSILIGYLIGNILPAYYFGRLKGIDIRSEGAEYAGTINVFHVLGVKYAIATGIIDFFKGIFAIQIALAFGVDFRMAQWAGLAAIAGHVLPFYLNFRGGQGVACATGIVIYYLVHFLKSGAILASDLLFLAIIVVLFAYIARYGEIISQIILPILLFTSIYRAPDDPRNVFFLLLVIYIMIVGIYNIVTRKLISFKSEDFVKYRWRIYLRPFALLFIFSYFIYGKNQTFFLIAALLLLAILFDVDRISGKYWLTPIFFKNFNYSKPHEKRTFSSITSFLFSCALVIIIFPRMITIVSILLLIFGDMFGKVFGTAFQRHRFFNKSLEGSLAFLGCGLICSYVLNIVFSFNLNLMILGTVAAVVAEAAFEKIDDNLTIPLASSLVMTFAHWGGMRFLVR